ncbi:MAG TPA: CooT family nickel-binding protein [Syntrophorhabdales bacterium]|nr:CooT family nickel-binding protein [Syntrophorhabdales bacterium]
MCQTAAYIVRDGQEELVLQDVISVVPGEGGVRLVNLFGEERTVPGRIRQIDLLAHRVIIQSGPEDACR